MTDRIDAVTRHHLMVLRYNTPLALRDGAIVAAQLAVLPSFHNNVSISLVVADTSTLTIRTASAELVGRDLAPQSAETVVPNDHALAYTTFIDSLWELPDSVTYGLFADGAHVFGSFTTRRGTWASDCHIGNMEDGSRLSSLVHGLLGVCSLVGDTFVGRYALSTIKEYLQ